MTNTLLTLLLFLPWLVSCAPAGMEFNSPAFQPGGAIPKLCEPVGTYAKE